MVVLADRRIGELTRKLPKAPPLAGPGRGKKQSPAAGPGFRQTKSTALRDLGITKQEAARCEAAASIPQREFDKAVEAERAKGIEHQRARGEPGAQRSARGIEGIATGGQVQSESTRVGFVSTANAAIPARVGQDALVQQWFRVPIEAKERMRAGGGDQRSADRSGKEKIPDPVQARDAAAKAVGVNPRLSALLSLPY